MRLNKFIVVLLLMVALITACSREGFEESLNRKASSNSSSQNVPAENVPDNSAFVFDFDIGEVTEEGVYLYYALARAQSDEAEAAAASISEKIHSAMFNFKDKLTQGKTVYKLNVFDAITRNDGSYFSTMYQADFRSAKDAPKEYYGFGLVFDAQTGEMTGIDAILDAKALAALLLDEQTAKINEKDDTLLKKKRDYLNEQGAKKLAQRLTYPDGIVTIERLMDASFYLDGTRLTAVFSAPQDIGGIIEVSVTLQ